MALTNTTTNAKFTRMRMQLGIPPAWLLGHLEMYWQYCHTHGHVMKCNLVEFAAGWAEAFPDRQNEFLDAAIDCGWIDWESGDFCEAHDYMANAPQFVRNRERVKEWREKKSGVTPCNAVVTPCNKNEQLVTPCNDSVMPCNAAYNIDVDVDVDVDKEPIEELLYDFAPQNPTPAPKIRKLPAKPATAPQFSDGFNAVWKAYPHYGGRSSKAKSWDKWRSMRLDAVVMDGDVIIYSPEKVLAWVNHLKTCDDWQKSQGQFVPALQVWLGNKLWTNGEPPTVEARECVAEWEV